MSVLSGKLGAVNGQSSVRNWNINSISAAQVAVHSATGGGTQRRPGARDWSGAFARYGAVPLVMPGEDFNFLGFTAPGNLGGSGSGGGTGYRWSGPAIVDSVAITWDWGASAIINHTVNFSGDGKLSGALGAQVLDGTEPDTPIPCGTKILVNDVEWENLLNAVLTLTSANQAYVNSSTVFDGECWTKRQPGPIDWTLAVTEQNEAGLGASMDIGDDVVLKIFVDDTDFWELSFAHVIDFSGLTVDRETGAIIQRTVNLGMNVHNGTDFGTGIILPGADGWFDPSP